MSRAVMASSMVVALVLGACAVGPEQGSTAPTTLVRSERVVDEPDVGKEQAVEHGESAEGLPDSAVSCQYATTVDRTTTSSVPVDCDVDAEPVDGDAILPEPGDGLVRPKSPNTTMIVPPLRD